MMVFRTFPGIVLAAALTVSAAGAVAAVGPGEAAAPNTAAPNTTAPNTTAPDSTTARHSAAGHGNAHESHSASEPAVAYDEARGSGEADLNPVSLEAIKGDLAIWTAVVFLVLLAVLWKFAWGPIASGLDKRETCIANQIEQAEDANRQAKGLLVQYGQKLDQAKDEVKGLIEQGRRDAEKIGNGMIEKAKGEAAAEHDRALREIDAAATAALRELAEKGADLAVDLAGKIVRAELKPSDHGGLIARAVADFTADQSRGNGTTK